MESIPPRLHGIVARAAPIIVIIRRGPSRWTQLIRWHTETDRFETGQWVHAHVFPRRSDLSPDGELLMYFASDYSRAETPTWTAISRPPYWTAIKFFPKQDSWGGGGLMTANDRFRLNGNAGEDYPIVAERLERDGWVLEQQFGDDHFSRVDVRRLSKTQPNGNLVLVMSAYATSEKREAGVGCYFERYAIRTATGEVLDLDGAEWAEWDQRGRLVYARDGKIFANISPFVTEDELLFTASTDPPVTEAAPAWATKPTKLLAFNDPAERSKRKKRR